MTRTSTAALYALAEPTNPGGAVGTFAISDRTHTSPTTTAASPIRPHRSAGDRTRKRRCWFASCMC
ncbi:hypothetical protein CSO01_01940 [Cellulomonas soli]|uniref:Uncharacterized protein n=1 Tax=Cellulomonas soli TaxID=931535 RepID=A0A512P8E7_9CELL|nr:hypothetical protein CSO01_01940 [Cellulomonas soli]